MPNTALLTILYLVFALGVIGSLLFLVRFFLQWKNREEIGEARLQRTLTCLGLFIGITIVLGLISHFFGAF